jgi:hypothetical protein
VLSVLEGQEICDLLQAKAQRLFRTPLVLAGRSAAEVNAANAEELYRGRLHAPTKAALAYLPRIIRPGRLFDERKASLGSTDVGDQAGIQGFHESHPPGAGRSGSKFLQQSQQHSVGPAKAILDPILAATAIPADLLDIVLLE